MANGGTPLFQGAPFNQSDRWWSVDLARQQLRHYHDRSQSGFGTETRLGKGPRKLTEKLRGIVSKRPFAKGRAFEEYSPGDAGIVR